jgi:hypothetical protein
MRGLEKVGGRTSFAGARFFFGAEPLTAIKAGLFPEDLSRKKMRSIWR